METYHVNTRDALVEYGQGLISIRMTTGKRNAASQARRLLDEVADSGDIKHVDLGFAREMVRVWQDFGECQQVTTYAGTHISVDRL